MAKKDEEEVEETTDTEDEDKPEKASKTSIAVKHRDYKGEPTERVFSKEVHGKDFAKLAEEFKKTNADKLIAE
jgi:hypothetical protein